MNGAELLVKSIEQEGVKYIFGVPGEENEDFLFALEDSDITFVPVRHEQGGAFMADMWGRLTGQSGVCLATLGPGATNLFTAVADAYLDKSPLVAITGQGNVPRLHQESHQMIDVVKMLAPITKWNAAVLDTATIPEIVRQAFKIAETPKYGPTHIELPEDIAGRDVDGAVSTLRITNIERPQPAKQAIEDAVKLIAAAKKPLIISGNGTIRDGAGAALTALCQQYDIPVATTFMGKGVVSDREAQSLGSFGLGFKDYVMEAFAESDLIISIGYDLVEYDPINWNPNNNKNIIHIDTEPAEVYMHYQPILEIIGDVRSAIDMLNESLSLDNFSSWYSEVRDRIRSSIEEYQLSDDEERFNAPGVIAALREVMPDDGLLISDVGTHKMWIARNYPTYISNGCIISNGLATMGIALPGAVAAKLVDEERTVVALMGDGGSMMNIQELETAKRMNTGCIMIIMNDNNYGLIEWKQCRSEGKTFGTKLGNPNFKSLAESFGIQGYRPENIKALKSTVQSAIASNELCVIELPIETEVNGKLTEQLDAYWNKYK